MFIFVKHFVDILVEALLNGRKVKNSATGLRIRGMLSYCEENSIVTIFFSRFAEYTFLVCSMTYISIVQYASCDRGDRPHDLVYCLTIFQYALVFIRNIYFFYYT